MSATLVYVNGKRVGSVSKGFFYKTVRSSKHFLRFPKPAIALDLKSLEEAEAHKAHTVKITDAETGVTYTATVEHIRGRGFIVDRGYGKQLALPLEGWIKSSRGKEIPTQATFFEACNV